MADVSNMRLNLISLQRIDNSISSIVDCGNVVVVYKYLSESAAWEETDVEGTLFVYLRSVEPQHGFIIMNRLNTKNVIQPVTSEIQFQIDSPFLLYRNGEGDINSIWFYEYSYCEKIGSLLIRLSRLVQNRTREKSPSGKPKNLLAAVPKLKKINDMDIMSMLTRAQEEFDKKSSDHVETSENTKKTVQNAGGIVKPTPLRANGAVLTNGTSVPLSIDTLFAQVGDGKHTFQGSSNAGIPNSNAVRGRSQSMVNSSQPKGTEPIPHSSENILQKLLTSNSIPTMGNSEEGNQQKQMKRNMKKAARTRSNTYSASPALVDRQTSVELVEKDLKEKLNIMPKGSDNNSKPQEVKDQEKPREKQKNVPLANLQIVKTEDSHVSSKPVDIPILTPAMLDLSSSLPSSNPPSFEVRARNVSENMCNTASFPLCLPSFPLPANMVGTKPSLLSPLDFKADNVSPFCDSPPSPLDFEASFFGHKEDLLLPRDLVQNAPIFKKKPAQNCVTPLTRNQFREALCYMIQNDDKFISELHECYLKSLKSHLNGYNGSSV